jgi:hypothetical protein
MSYASSTTPYPCNDPMVGIDRWPPMEAPEYGLRGPQVEPGASYWSSPPCPPPCVVTVADLTPLTDLEKLASGEKNPCWFPPYPTGTDVDDELAELHELAQLRDDPEAVASNDPERRRLGISQFLQLVPQPLSAVVNTDRRRDASLITTGPERLMAQVGPFTPPPFRSCDGRECCEEFFPVVRTGRELARYFEAETPGLSHRLALNYLLRDANFSAPYDELETCARRFCDCCKHKPKPTRCDKSGVVTPATSEHEQDTASGAKQQGESTDISEEDGEPSPRPQRTETAAGSGRAVREQSRGPQQGAAPAGSSEAVREQSRGPQQGAVPAGSSEAVREQSRSPQQGAG